MSVGIDMRNGMLMHKAKYIRYILHRYTKRNSEDDYHNAIIYLCRKIDSWEPEKGSLNTWIWLNTRASIGYRRVETDRLSYVEQDILERAPCDDTPSTAMLDKEYNEARNRVANYAMSNLDAYDNWLIHQYIWKQRTYESIAREEQVTSQAIGMRIRRIFRDMRLYIEENWIDDIR